MNAFADLVPDNSKNSFEDLVPKKASPFEDLVPQNNVQSAPLVAASPELTENNISVQTEDLAPAPVARFPSMTGLRDSRAAESILAERALQAAPPASDGPVMEPTEATMLNKISDFIDQAKAGSMRGNSISESLMEILTDKIPEVDPSDGHLMTDEEKRARRALTEQSEIDRLVGGEAETVAEKSAEMLGVLVRELKDPINLVGGSVGATAKGFDRVRKLAAAGGVLEGSAGALEQVAEDGGITDGSEIALRAAAGAVASPALDALVEKVIVPGMRGTVRKLADELDKAKTAAASANDNLIKEIAERNAQAIADELDEALVKGGVPEADIDSLIGNLSLTEVDDGVVSANTDILDNKIFDPVPDSTIEPSIENSPFEDLIPETVIDKPTPEAPETLSAQLRAFDEGRKPGVLLTEGESLSEALPEGSKIAQIPDRGILIYKDEATLDAAMNDRMGEALGYGVDEKPLSETVITARDSDGIVVDDIVTDGRPEIEQAAVNLAGPDGSVELRHAGDALDERELSRPAKTSVKSPEELERVQRAKDNGFDVDNPVYHGTASDIEHFDPYSASKYGLFGNGIYMTDSPKVASVYAGKNGDGGQNVLKLYHAVKNPIDMDAELNYESWVKAFPDAEEYEIRPGMTNKQAFRAYEEFMAESEFEKWEAEESAKDLIRSMGFDGITHQDVDGYVKSKTGEEIPHKVVIAFEPEQVRSVNADFDASKKSSGNILYSNPFDVAARVAGHTLKNNSASAIAGGIPGGMYAGAESEHEPLSAKWWTDVGAGAAVGAAAGIGGFGVLKKAKISGEKGIARRGADVAFDHLDRWLGKGPKALEDFKHKQEVMRQYLERQAGEVGEYLLNNFTPTERAQMSDLIEGRGIVSGFNRVHRQAEALDGFLSEMTKKMKDLNMIAADTKEGGYLHRYYAKHLGLDKDFQSAKRQSLSGSYSIARGTDDVFKDEFFSPAATTDIARFRDLSGQIRQLEKQAQDGGDSSQLEGLYDEISALKDIEFTEFVGEQNGKLKSFFFAKDETGRVPGELAQRAGDDPITINPSGEAITASSKPDNMAPTDRIWKIKATDNGQVKLKRDWTTSERNSWGEIQDAGYRFTRGMVEVSHDLSMATFFERVSRNSEWVSDVAKVTNKGKEWVAVPTQKVKGGGLEKYGHLAGKFVRPDAWRAIKSHGVTTRPLGSLGDFDIPLTGKLSGTPTTVNQLYKSGINKWKLYKTVYNPVTHLNNIYSNVEMLYMGGYGPKSMVDGMIEISKGADSQYWKEGQNIGLFHTDFGSALLQTEGKLDGHMKELTEAMLKQRDDVDGILSSSYAQRAVEWFINSKAAVGSADGVGQTGVELARALSKPVLKGLKTAKKPVDKVADAMQSAYRFEDDIFKMAAFVAERKAGKSIDDARNAANDLFFDYMDLPPAVKALRDFPVGSPFISYTYKAVPAIARNIATNPERVIAIAMAYEAWNYSVLVNQGMNPDQYLETIDAYQETLPPWDRGRAVWGASNFLLDPDGGHLLSMGNMHAMGNPFVAESGRKQTVELPGPLKALGPDVFGSNPLRALLDAGLNEDWKGQKIYENGDPDDVKTKKIITYLYQAWAPSNVLTPGSYHQTKVLEGLANDARENPEGLAAPIVGLANDMAEAMGFEQFTGLTRGGKEVDSTGAISGSFGIKHREIDTASSVKYKLRDLKKEQGEIRTSVRRERKKRSQGRITDETFQAYRGKQEPRKQEILEKKRTVKKARQTLKDLGLK